jgi:hypothetical protein
MAEYSPPENDYYSKDESDSINVDGIQIDLSDYLKLQQATNLFVGKSRMNEYNTKDEITNMVDPIQTDIDNLENKTSLFTKINDNTIKLTGNLQLDQGQISEISHEQLKINDSIEITSSEAIPLKINENFSVNLTGEISSNQITDLTNRIETVENQDLSSTYYDKNDVDSFLNEKVDSTFLEQNYLTDTDIESTYAKQTDLTNYTLTSDINTQLAEKANTSDVNTALDLKVNTIDVNTALDLKANSSDVYTKTEIIDTSGETETGILSEYAKKSELGTVSLGNTTYDESTGITFQDDVQMTGNLTTNTLATTNIVNVDSYLESTEKVVEDLVVSINDNSQQINNIQTLMNQSDEKKAYNIGTNLSSTTTTNYYDNIDITGMSQSVSSSSYVYNASNIIDGNLYTTDDVLIDYQFKYNSTTPTIEIELPYEIDISSFTIFNASSNETTDYQIYSEWTQSAFSNADYHYTTTTKSNNNFYVKEFTLYGYRNNAWYNLGSYSQSSGDVSKTFNIANGAGTTFFSHLKMEIDEVNEITYTYRYDKWWQRDTTETGYIRDNGRIAEIKIGGYTQNSVNYYTINSVFGIQKLTQDASLDYTNDGLEIDTINNRINVTNVLNFGTNLGNSDSDLPTNMDGCFYRWGGDLELMCDDNFFIRDNTTTGDNQEFHFNTGSGFFMKAGTSSSNTQNGYGFKMYSNGNSDRIVIHQNEGGGGGYFYYNRSNNYGTSSDMRIKENIQDLEQSDIDFLLKIRPRKFKLKDTEEDCCQYGLIAQEVVENVSTGHQKNIVNHYDEYIEDENTEEILGLSYQSFIPLLIKLTQQQEEKIKVLEQEKETINQKLEEIKSLILGSSSAIQESTSKTETILYSESISKLKQTVYHDGLSKSIEESSLLLHLVNSINYLVSELDRVKFIVNHS